MSEKKTTQNSPELPEDIVETLNQMRGGFARLIGLQFISVTLDEIVAQVEVTPDLLQPYGLVHGGVYSSIVETIASTGAAINLFSSGLSTVGLDNHTSFLRAVRSGVLTGTATPVRRGRRTHVWSVAIRDDRNRLVADGRVRMICLEPGSSVGGKEVVLADNKTALTDGNNNSS